MEKKEIERKWLLAVLPDGAKTDGKDIEQGYCKKNGGSFRVRRVRSEDGGKPKHYFTVKGKGALVRDEWEQKIPAWVFAELWPLTEKRRLVKTRYTMPWAGVKLEFDVFGGSLAGLVLVECEFPDEDAAHAFALPAWVGAAVEVTGDKRYLNANLAFSGTVPER